MQKGSVIKLAATTGNNENDTCSMNGGHLASNNISVYSAAST